MQGLNLGQNKLQKKYSWWLGVVLGIMFVVGLASCTAPPTTALPHSGTELRVGMAAPDFELPRTTGGRLTLAALRGQPLLINFWATWCAPCRLEMPELVKAANAHPELVILAINEAEEVTQITPFAREFHMEMPILLDEVGDVRRAYQVRGLPASIFIDRTGTITALWLGPLTTEKLNELLQQTLADSS